MRIVSLLPSATEICFELGLGRFVVGVTHECDYPDWARKKPQVTRSLTHEGLSSREIDSLVRSQLEDSGSIYSLDREMLEALDPELILTQRLCTVCAVTIDTVREIAGTLPSKPQVENLEPTSMADVFRTMRRVAELVGRVEECAPKIAKLEERYRNVRRLTKDLEPVRTLVLEWIDPPFACGHWIPELVEKAGGVNTLAFKGRPSREIAWEQARESHPEVVIIAACGMGIERQKKELEIIVEQLGLHGLARETSGAPKLWICDGSQYFSRPGPRLVETTELLAAILHPELRGLFGPKFRKGIDFEHIDYGTTAYIPFREPSRTADEWA